MIKKQNLIGISLGKLENTCFAIMPFEPAFTNEYEHIIKPAMGELGIQCVRADEIFSKPRIMDDIWKSIRTARFVVAELSSKNPNVFYEVGLAHAIGKPVIILTRNEDDVPFDLKALRYLYYDTNDPYWGDNLRKTLKTMADQIMQQEDLSTYLDGITAIGEIAYPTIPIAQAVPAEPIESIPDLSGSWKYEFTTDGGNYTGLMTLRQTGEKLTGTMTIGYFQKGAITTVQEELSGTVNGGLVALNGVSYTFINQGDATSYMLDNFEMTLTADARSMEGRVISEDQSGPAKFLRMEDSNTLSKAS